MANGVTRATLIFEPILDGRRARVRSKCGRAADRDHGVDRDMIQRSQRLGSDCKTRRRADGAAVFGHDMQAVGRRLGGAVHLIGNGKRIERPGQIQEPHAVVRDEDDAARSRAPDCVFRVGVQGAPLRSVQPLWVHSIYSPFLYRRCVIQVTLARVESLFAGTQPAAGPNAVGTYASRGHRGELQGVSSTADRRPDRAHTPSRSRPNSARTPSRH